MNESRRRFLQLSGAATVATLAGCAGGASDSTTTEDGAANGATDTATATPGTRTATTDFGGWLADTSNFDGTVRDARDEDALTIAVGASGNSGNFAFEPAAVTIDPGGTVTWEWTGEGGSHNVVDESGSFESGDPTDTAGDTYEQTFSDAGVVKYFCRPHRDLGMRGVVVVGDPDGDGTVADGEDGDDGGEAYGWQAATFDSYWYSLFNMSTNIAMSGNGILFPNNEEQRAAFQQRIAGIAKHADVDRPPVVNPNLNVAPFTTGDPHFSRQPVFEDDTGRPDADTLAWDRSMSSGVVSPASVAWTHLKGVTWAKNFENHVDLLPKEVAPKFRAQVLTTLAQLGTKFALVDGTLRADDDTLVLGSEFTPGSGLTDASPRLTDHAAFLWFLSDLTSLASNGWFGYRNPEPLIPAANIQKLTDGMAKTTMSAFSPAQAAQAGTTRDLGILLGAVGWYGTHAGSTALASQAATYAAGVADQIASNGDGTGRIAGGASNQAATQGAVAQGLAWASQIDGVDRTGLAADAVGYLEDELWDAAAGTFASGADDDRYLITARDAGDVTGGLNAADAVLGTSGVRDTFARFFDSTFNRGRLQRAQRPVSVDSGRDDQPPVPPQAGGQFGQAAVSNREVAYDTTTGEWAVTDPTFHTAEALYLANQEIWTSHWGGEFFEGRGVPGRNDQPPA
ncbi:MAG: halocyanin domain-containing protein [Haloarculaceae archaeon]